MLYDLIHNLKIRHKFIWAFDRVLPVFPAAAILFFSRINFYLMNGLTEYAEVLLNATQYQA